MNATIHISLEEAAAHLLRGEIGIVPTDTIYSFVFVASAMLPEAVERLYRARGRNEQKSCIVLIAECADIDRFGRAFRGSSTGASENVAGKGECYLSRDLG